MLRSALVGALVVCAAAAVVVVGVFAYHSAAADRAQAAPAAAAVTSAFEEAERRWRRNVGWPPVHRLVLRSAEEYGSGIYLFVFDMYYWFGVGSGYMTFGPETEGVETRTTACSGGGIVRDGGFAGIAESASDAGLSETRAGCTRTYGSGRVVAPTSP